MIIATSDQIEAKRIVQTIGMVRGSVIKARDVGVDIDASMSNLAGGEVPEYTKLLAESREQAVQRMVEDAEKQGANAIVGVRFPTSMIISRAVEMLAYGTAVKAE